MMNKNFIELADKVRSVSEKENKGLLFERVSVSFLYALVVVIIITCIITTAVGGGNTHFDYTEPDNASGEITSSDAAAAIPNTSGVSQETTSVQETTTTAVND